MKRRKALLGGAVVAGLVAALIVWLARGCPGDRWYEQWYEESGTYQILDYDAATQEVTFAPGAGRGGTPRKGRFIDGTVPEVGATYQLLVHGKLHQRDREIQLEINRYQD
jgi:hypothetical protein